MNRQTWMRLTLFGLFLLIAVIVVILATGILWLTFTIPLGGLEQAFFIFAIGGILTAGLLCFIAHRKLQRELITPLNQLKTVASQLIDGHSEVDELPVDPAFGNVAQAMNKIAKQHITDQQNLAIIQQEKQQIQTESQRRIRELDLINHINQTLLASVDLETTADAVLRNVKSLFDYSSAEINIWNHEDQVFDAHTVGASSYSLASGNYYLRDEGFTGWLYQHRQPLGIPNIPEFSDAQPKLPLKQLSLIHI